MQEVCEVTEINRAFIIGMKRRTNERIQELHLEYNRMVKLLPEYPHYIRHCRWVRGLLEINENILAEIS